MAILPVRDLGSVGVITDRASYNIPINGFSTGINVRFDEGKVRRAPCVPRGERQPRFYPTRLYWLHAGHRLRQSHHGH